MNILYRTEATATGGRTGSSATNDGKLAVTLDTVKELGGAGGPGTNPEQLFALGYSACFLGALKYVAAQKKVKLSDETTITAKIGIGPREDGGGFGLELAITAHLPGIEKAEAEALVAAADIVCPYSNLAHKGAAVALAVD